MDPQEYRSEEREHLGFAEAVQRHIEPVLRAFGFRRIETSCYGVLYESPEVVMQIIHEPVSYEIEVEFRRTMSPCERCTLGGVLASEGRDCLFQASTPDRVNTAIAEIADLLRRHGKGVLSGDAETYQRLTGEARALSEACTKAVVQQPIRTAAHDAWQRRDYAEVRSLYESIAADLTPIERKRLDYARAHSCEA